MIRDFDMVKLKRDVINIPDTQGEVVNLPMGSIVTVVMI